MDSGTKGGTWDCVIVGAGPAGLNAALVLGRTRRRVVVLDNAQPRNYATHEMHGVLGHDGLDPADLRARGRQTRAESASTPWIPARAARNRYHRSCVRAP